MTPLKGGLSRPSARGRLDQQPIPHQQADLDQGQRDHEQQRQHERELDRRGYSFVTRLGGIHVPHHVVDNLVEELAQLARRMRHAIRTTAIAAARIRRAYSAVVCPSSRRRSPSRGTTGSRPDRAYPEYSVMAAGIAFGQVAATIEDLRDQAVAYEDEPDPRLSLAPPKRPMGCDRQ